MRLSYYLSQIGAVALSKFYRIVDITYPDRGRCRLSYVPQEDSHIVIMPAKMGLNSHLQRSNEDAQRLARRMKKGEIPI